MILLAFRGGDLMEANAEEKIRKMLNNTLNKTDFPGLGEKYEGKVRDNYMKGDKRFLITTDRISAFDRVLGTIPYKGQVLTQMAKFWFDETKDICRNHMLDSPDPNVMVAKELQPLPVEAVVRGYITGVTTTSAWHNYEQGVRNFCGNELPEGLKKNQKFDQPIFTPSTKAEKGDHDKSVSKKEILEMGLLTNEQFEEMKEKSFKLFERGTKIAAKNGIILVDTKYEFGLLDGEMTLMDEIHTPDSSRFWYQDTYNELFEKGEEQKKIDKEYVREWLADKGFLGEGEIPEIPDDVKVEAAKRYITAFELITGQEFKLEDPEMDINKRIENNLREKGYLE